MKQLTIKLHNKQKLLLVEIPVGAINFRNPVLESGEKPEVLGYYSPRTDEIDFLSSYDWTEDTVMSDLYIYNRDYLTGEFKLGEDFTKQDSFKSLLKSETEKAFPLKENEYGEMPKKEDYNQDIMSERLSEQLMKNDMKTWQNSESKVMPERFIVLLIK